MTSRTSARGVDPASPVWSHLRPWPVPPASSQPPSGIVDHGRRPSRHHRPRGHLAVPPPFGRVRLRRLRPPPWRGNLRRRTGRRLPAGVQGGAPSGQTRGFLARGGDAFLRPRPARLEIRGRLPRLLGSLRSRGGLARGARRGHGADGDPLPRRQGRRALQRRRPHAHRARGQRSDPPVRRGFPFRRDRRRQTGPQGLRPRGPPVGRGALRPGARGRRPQGGRRRSP